MAALSLRQIIRLFVHRNVELIFSFRSMRFYDINVLKIEEWKLIILRCNRSASKVR